MRVRPSPHLSGLMGVSSRVGVSFGVLCVLATGLVLSGCGGETVRLDDRFWLRAPGEALLRVTPPPPPGAPGAVLRHTVEGTVKRHVASVSAGVDYRLTVETRAGKPAEFAYQLGAGRRLPLEPGNTVRILALSRGHAADDGQDHGLLVYRVETETVATPNGDAALKAPAGPAKQTAKQTAKQGEAAAPQSVSRPLLIAAVDQNQVLEPGDLPPALRGLLVTDVAAYKQSGRFRGDCQDIREHRYFRLTAPELLTRSDAKVLNDRLYAPGSRLFMRESPTHDFDIVLLSNLAVTRSSCHDRPDPTWSWAGIRAVRPAATKDAP